VAAFCRGISVRYQHAAGVLRHSELCAVLRRKKKTAALHRLRQHRRAIAKKPAAHGRAACGSIKRVACLLLAELGRNGRVVYATLCGGAVARAFKPLNMGGRDANVAWEKELVQRGEREA